MLNEARNTSLYRTNDSVDNFRLKVIIRETSKSYGPDGRRNNESYEEESTLSWQEKKYGPGDIANFLSNKDKRIKDSSDADMFRHMHMLEERDKPLVNMLQPVMLYTYTDKKPRKSMDRAPVRFSTDENIEPYLGVAVAHNNARSETGEREQRAGDRLYRERPFKVMNVCLATDVDVEALKEKPMYPEAHYKEHILCSIRIFDEGLLEFTPDMSGVLDEKGSRGADPIAPSIFSNDATVAASLQSSKGLKLNSYRVHSHSGREFEYFLINENEVVSPIDLEQLRHSELAKDSIVAKANRVVSTMGENSSSWKQDPPSRGFDKSLAMYAEIVSGKNFNGDRLFVNYEVLVPQGWNLRTGNLVDGIGEQDLINKAMGDDGVIDNSKEAAHAAAARNLLDTDGYADGDDAEGMLRGITHIALCKDYASGLSLPIERPFWKGNRRSNVLDPFSRHFWGYFYFFFNVLCVILGVHSPFWIVSAILIVFALLSGSGGGPSQAIIIDNKEKGRGARKSVSHRVLSGPLVSEPRANFNHLLNLSFDVKDENIREARGAPSTTVPTIIFTVYSVGSFGQLNLEGYGYHHLPETGDQQDVEIQTWKPLGGINSQMRDYFLGSAPHLMHPESYLTTGYDKSHSSSTLKGPTPLNRFGTRSENSGLIRFRFQSCVSDPRLVIHPDDNEESKKVDKKLEGARRTVNEILKNYRNGADLSKSMEMATSARGVTLSRTSYSSGSTDLSKRAEMLIAQAKARISASASSSSAIAGIVSSNAAEEKADLRASEEDTPLLGTRTRVQPLEMHKVAGASRRVRRYAGEGEGEE